MTHNDVRRSRTRASAPRLPYDGIALFAVLVSLGSWLFFWFGD
ncbi:hypothetical protein [Variovorax sp. EL159]|nr:hypothetical protein [Variovorax sp. EL159]SCX68973.1 hypothetical protein SAMN03159363_3403 [Variovorax sp. EL159]